MVTSGLNLILGRGLMEQVSLELQREGGGETRQVCLTLSAGLIHLEVEGGGKGGRQ